MVIQRPSLVDTDQMNCLNISEYAVCIAAIVAIVAGIAAIPEIHYEKGSIYVLHQIGYSISSIYVTINALEMQ